MLKNDDALNACLMDIGKTCGGYLPTKHNDVIKLSDALAGSEDTLRNILNFNRHKNTGNNDAEKIVLTIQSILLSYLWASGIEENK